MPSNAYRLNARERSEMKLEKSKPAGVRRHPIRQKKDHVLLWKKVIAGTLLFPLGVVTAFTLVEVLFRALTRADFWRSEQFVFFTTGGAAWACAYAVGWRPVHAYVLGHELSHLVVARAFGGRIFSWSASPAGGYVETDKTNTWITLAPYILPFYSVAVVLLFGIAGMFIDLRQTLHLPLGSRGMEIAPVWFFYAALGLTWWFHVTYTVKTVLTRQSDLVRNGEFFSMSLIFLINALLIAVLYLAASPRPGYELVELGRCWMGTAGWMAAFLRQVLG